MVPEELIGIRWQEMPHPGTTPANLTQLSPSHLLAPPFPVLHGRSLPPHSHILPVSHTYASRFDPNGTFITEADSTMFRPVSACSQSHQQIYIKVESDPDFRANMDHASHHCNRYEHNSASFGLSGGSNDYALPGAGVRSCMRNWQHGRSLVSSSSDCSPGATWLGEKATSSLSSSTGVFADKEQKRDRANEQERRRMKQINDALDDLRLVLRDKPIPVLPASVQKHRESKIKTLTAAIAYIKFLQEQLGNSK